MKLLSDLFSLGMSIVLPTVQGMAPTPAPSPVAVTPPRKRKLADIGTPPGRKDIFPVFTTPSSSSSPGKSKSKLSPGSSPSKKRANLTLKQGASQNNKIFRYLQPQRLLNKFENHGAATEPLVSAAHDWIEQDNKENKIVNRFQRRGSEEKLILSPSISSPITPNRKPASTEEILDVKVVLVRLDDNTCQEHSYCLRHQSPKKLCCLSAAERVTQAIDNLIDDDVSNPCRRLGIPLPICLSSSGCKHLKSDSSPSAYQENLYATMVNVDLPIAMIRACCQDLSDEQYPSPAAIHSVFDVMKNTADQTVLTMGKSYLRRVLDKYPPCNPKMRSHYIHVLNSSESKVKIPSGLWGLRSLEFFESILAELESHIDRSLDPQQLKERSKVPGVRKKVVPLRYRQSPSPRRRTSQRPVIEDIPENPDIAGESSIDILFEVATKKRLDAEVAIETMTNFDRTAHIFARFETLVDILEWDLVVWLSRNGQNLKIRDRTVCPLVVLALWRPEADTGFDSNHCRRIFSMYASAWVLKFHPRHLRTLARFIGLIAEVTRASEPNFSNVYPYVGEGCENLGRKLSDVLRNPLLEEFNSKAVAMMKPDWLKMLISSNLLNVSPTIASLDSPTLQNPMSKPAIHLWAQFLDAVIEFYHLKEAITLLRHASQGKYKEDRLVHNSTSIRMYKINYSLLLREIVLYYNMQSKLKERRESRVMPHFLTELLIV